VTWLVVLSSIARPAYPCAAYAAKAPDAQRWRTFLHLSLWTLSMSKLSMMVAGACLLALAGCSSESKTSASVDMCSHCAGTQMITSKGTCDGCGMKVDCCTSCPGEQTLTADGKCPGCGATVPVKP